MLITFNIIGIFFKINMNLISKKILIKCNVD
jgi:hypothetical protein